MKENIKSFIKCSDKCESAWSKGTGFMFCFSKKPKLFIFKKDANVSIHTFFCFFPLKIFYLDSKMRIKKGIIAKPFRVFPSVKARYVLEVPAKVYK